MKFRNLLIASSVVVSLAWGVGWAQQTTDAQGSVAGAQASTTSANPTDNTTANSNHKKGEKKEKHWNGSLIDVGCMEKELSGSNETGGGESGTPAVSHFLGGGSPLGQVGQGGQGQGPTTPNIPGGQSGRTTPNYPGQSSNPQMNGPDAAEMARVKRIEAAIKQCAATSSTQAFGLALSGGQVMRFDQDGNTKATEALKAANVQPGKKVKAKVMGTMEGSSTVKVASVEVKGNKKASGSASSPGQ